MVTGSAAGRRGDVDGAGRARAGDRPGGGVPGVPAGAGEFAEHGEVVCAGAGVVVVLPGRVRPGLGCRHVVAGRRVLVVAADRGRPAGDLDRAAHVLVQRVDDLGAPAGGDVLLPVL